jgi:hypothetical protein
VTKPNTAARISIGKQVHPQIAGGLFVVLC